jgi:ribonuclease P protein component
MNERLSSPERIRRKRDFIRLYKSGRRFRGRYFTLIYGPNSLGASRLAVVVSKKVGPAVARNRVKRRIKDLFRRNKDLLQEPTDLIAVARKEVVGLAAPELRAAYIQALDSVKKKRTSL